MKGHNGNSINAAYCVTSHWSQLKKNLKEECCWAKNFIH